MKIRVNGPDDLRRTGFKGQVTLKLDQQLNPEFETETIPFKVPPRDKVELDPASLLLGRVIRPKEPLVVEYLDPPAGVKPNWSIIREDTGKVEQLVDIRDWEFNQSADERGSYTVRLVGTDPTGKRNDSEPLDKTFEVVDLDVVIKGPSEIPSSFGPDERASGGGDYKAELVGQDAGKYELDRATWDVSKANYETVEDQVAWRSGSRARWRGRRQSSSREPVSRVWPGKFCLANSPRSVSSRLFLPPGST